MANTQTCPQCHSPLPAGTPEGLCPACLFRRGLESNTVPGATETSAQWTPPAAANLADLFPELDLLELIGRGGMGAVYKARQKTLARVVALKILPPEIGRDPAFADRFTREAQALATLNHPHIVTIHDFGRRGDFFFFIMEYVDGLNLSQLLGAGRISATEALAIVPQICEALQYAHDHAIVHRDIKPENILLSRSGEVKIADFGLAKLMSHSSSDATWPEPVMGTPHYMAPEQTERPAEVDHRADIYALGVVFYQMLTGELPTGNIEPPSRKVVIDVRLDEVVLRALERSPERRYQQAGEVKTQLDTIAITPRKQSNESAVVETRQRRFTNNSRLSRKAIIGAVWAVIGILALLWMSVLEGQRAPRMQDMSSVEKMGFVITEVVLTVGFLSVIGTTILGCVALFQIRRSQGRLRGMRLAFLDTLFFILLAIDALIVNQIQTTIRNQFVSNPHVRNSFPVSVHFRFLQILLLIGICALTDLVIIRVLWRLIKRLWIGTPRLPATDTRKAGLVIDLILSLTAILGAVELVRGPHHYSSSVLATTISSFSPPTPSTTQPIATPEQLAELPQLCLIARQDEVVRGDNWKNWSRWHADGSVGTNKQDLARFNEVQSGSPLQRWPTFNLWFSHPLFNGQCFAEVTLLDNAGQILPGRVSTTETKGPEGFPIPGMPGGIMATWNPDEGANIPPTVEVRLRYTIGSPEDVADIPPDLPAGAYIFGKHNGSRCNGVGQDTKGNAFLSLAIDMKNDGDRQFSVVAVTKDGRDLNPQIVTVGGDPVFTQHIVFNIPLADVAKFRLGARLIRTIEFKNVSMKPAEKP